MGGGALVKLEKTKHRTNVNRDVGKEFRFRKCKFVMLVRYPNGDVR